MKVIYNYEEVKLNSKQAGTLEEKLADRITVAANIRQDLSDYDNETRSMVREAIDTKKLNVSRLESIMASVGWDTKKISHVLRSYGVYRKPQGKACARAKKSQALDGEAHKVICFIKKQIKGSAKDRAAIARRAYMILQDEAK
jgi:hypothetical protein